MLKQWNLIEPSIRVTDENLIAFLRQVRTRLPKAAELQDWLTDRIVRIDSGLRKGIAKLLEKTPDVMVLCMTREGARLMNDTFIMLLCQTALGTIDTWTESQEGTLSVTPLTIFKGMRIMLTKNMDENDDLVNGCLLEILHLHHNSLKVKMPDGTKRLLWRTCGRARVSSNDLIRRAFHIVPAYACTVHKVQGATLKTAAIWFELERKILPGPGLGYVAASRVSARSDLSFLGEVTPACFRPVEDACAADHEDGSDS